MDLVLLAVRGFLSVIFLMAGILKLLDRAGSQKASVAFGVPSVLAPWAAVLLPVLEVGIGFGLLARTSSWLATIAATILLLAFTLAITYNIARGRNPDCHCFGQLHSSPAGWSTLLRNCALLGLSGWLVTRGDDNLGPGLFSWLSSQDPMHVTWSVFGALIAISVAVFTWGFFQVLQQNGRLLIRLEALEARLNLTAGAATSSHGAGFAGGLPVGSSAPSFQLPAITGGSVSLDQLLALGKPTVLIFSDPTCGPCAALLPDILRWQKEHANRLTFALVSRGTAAANRAKLRKYDIAHCLMQQDREIAVLYKCVGTVLRNNSCRECCHG